MKVNHAFCALVWAIACSGALLAETETVLLLHTNLEEQLNTFWYGLASGVCGVVDVVAGSNRGHPLVAR